MKDKATNRQAVLGRPSDDLNLIDNLHDAFNVGDDLLCQLLLKKGAELALQHKHASFGFAGDASERRA